MDGKRYIVTKQISTPSGDLKEGSVISFTHGFAYFNGGMVSTAYQNLLAEVVRKEIETGMKNIREEMPIYNKV